MPLDRTLEIAAFLDQHGWGEASVQTFDGDFSPRRYARLTDVAGRKAILMDADENQKTGSFVLIDKILRTLGLKAPEIYAALPDRGLVLMQDYGTRNVGALLDGGADPKDFFLRATDILVRLHQRFDRASVIDLNLPLFNTDLFTTQAEWFLDAYFPLIKQREAAAEERQDFCAAWQAVLRPLETMPKSLLLRDFMLDNLMDLPQNEMGLLDFQDAGIGCVAYDLASLCEEVRRDGGFAFLPDIIAYYCARSETVLSSADLLRACTIFSAQRHMRHLGNLAAKDKRSMMPRVKKHLSGVLQEPYLMPVREWVGRYMGETQ